MTLHGLLMWSLGTGAVVFTGAAGATGYQLLAHHAHDQALRVAETSSAASSQPPAAAAAPPATAPRPTAAQAPAATSASPGPSRSAVTPHAPLRRQVASAAVTSEPASRTPDKRVAGRPTAQGVAAHHPLPLPPSPPPATAQRQDPRYRPGGYAVQRQPAAPYSSPPPTAYYSYPGTYGYGSGYYALYAPYPRYRY